MRWKRKKFLVLIVIVLVVLYVGVYVMPLSVTDNDISVLDESKSHVDLDENFYAQPVSQKYGRLGLQFLGKGCLYAPAIMHRDF